MNNIYRYILEKTTTGSINKEMSIELLKMLKQQQKNYSKDEIAIIGMYSRLPDAEGVEQFWNNLTNGIVSTADLPLGRKKDIESYLRHINWDKQKVSYKRAAYLNEIDKFDHEFFKISSTEANLMDPNQRQFLEVAWSALEDAGYGGNRLSGSRTGVYVGFNGMMSNVYQQAISNVEPESLSMALPGNIAAIIASRISYLLNLTGPSMLIDTACSSSLVAIHLACQGLHNGDCEVAIAGGVKIDTMAVDSGISIGIESSVNQTRTFDARSDGMVLGEGVIAIVLKPLAKAVRDRDHIYAVIKGSAINQDGSSNGITAPNPSAQEDVIVRSWHNANIDPQTISYIEAHGTGTDLGDTVEIQAITKAFRRFTSKKGFCGIGSVKTNIGHLDNAAGISGVLKAVLSLYHKQIPASLHFKEPNAKINFIDSPVYVNDRLNEWQADYPRRCGISSFGLSGTNCHIVVEEAPERIASSNGDDRQHLFTLSAKSAEALQRLLQSYIRALEANESYALGDVCYTANSGRGHYSYRLAVTAESTEDLRRQLKALEGTAIHRSKPVEGEQKRYTELISSKLEECRSGGGEQGAILKEICSLYALGGEVDWKSYYSNTRHSRVPLPVYSFDRTRCWLDLKQAGEEHALAPLFHEFKWDESPLQAQYDRSSKPALMVMLLDDERLYQEIIVEQRREGHRVVIVSLSEHYRELDKDRFFIRSTAEDYARLFQELRSQGEVTHIIHCLTLNPNERSQFEGRHEHERTRGVYSLFYINKAVAGHTHPIDMLIMTSGVNRIARQGERYHPDNATLVGLGKAINMENLYLKCRYVDCDTMPSKETWNNEIAAGYRQYAAAYRDGVRYSEVLQASRLSDAPDQKLEIKPEGIYIITGGTGNLGLHAAQYLADQGKANIALLARSAFPDRSQWHSILLRNEDVMLCDKLRRIMEIERNGTAITILACDVSNEQEVERALAILRSDYRTINGVIHCAGTLGLGQKLVYLKDVADTQLNKELAAKVHGTWLIDRLTESDSLQFFILFSSAVTVMAGVGVGGYTAANSFLDTFTYYRNQKQRPTLCINWTGWRESVANYDYSEQKYLFDLITTEQALAAFDYAIKKAPEKVIIGRLNLTSSLFALENHVSLPFRVSDEIRHKREPDSPADHENNRSIRLKEIEITGNPSGCDAETKQLANVIGNILGIERLDMHDNFYEFGLDSFKAVQIVAKLKDSSIQFGDLLKYPSLAELTNKTIGMRQQLNLELSIEKNNDSRNQEAAKVLGNVAPFNDVFYKSCFYHAFIPVVRHFGGDIRAILADEVAAYRYLPHASGMKLALETSVMNGPDKILRDIGIKAHSVVTSADVIRDIIQSITNDRPAIVLVDCYHLRIRPDMYGMHHWAHFILVYGFDNESRQFHIIEHDGINNLTYQERLVSYEELANAYEGYQQYFEQSDQVPTLYEFAPRNGRMNPSSSREHAQNYADHLKVKQQEIVKGLEALRLVQDDFQQLFSNEKLLDKHADEIIQGVNSIIIEKNMEKYRFQQLFGSNETIAVLDEIIRSFIFIKSIIEKYKYSSRYKPASLQKAVDALSLIANLEQQYVQALYQESVPAANKE